MTTRKTQVDNYIAHTNQLMEGLTFFGKSYIGEDKLFLSATYSYAYWLLCQSIELIDEGEKIYEMISTSLMYDFKDEMEFLRKDFIEVYSTLKYSFFEELESNESHNPNPDIDASLLSLLDKYISGEYSHDTHSFADAYQVLSNSREKLHNAGVFIYRLLECTLSMIKKQHGRYRHLRNRTDEEFIKLWYKVVVDYQKSEMYRKDLDGYLNLISQKLNDSNSDKEILSIYKDQFYKTTEDIYNIAELGDIWRRSNDNFRDLACNLVRNECKDEYRFNKFISLVHFVKYLENEIVELQNKLKGRQTKIKVVKEIRKRGNKKTVIFRDGIDETKLAQSIKSIFDRYYSTSGKRIEFDKSSFGQTDFLISIYYALVKLEIAISALESISNSYYEFLENKCKIPSLSSKRTYDNHLSLLKAEGKDFHNLNDATITKFENSGGFSKEEFPLWQEMVAIAEEELKGDEYIKSILKLNNGNSSESFQYE